MAAEQQLSKQQSDNLKWQQESFHQILKLMGLCKEGILAETEVSAFKSHLLDTLVASPADYEQPTILKDKLVFLQVLLVYPLFFPILLYLSGKKKELKCIGLVDFYCIISSLVKL